LDKLLIASKSNRLLMPAILLVDRISALALQVKRLAALEKLPPA
jgi:hypothetical protein